MKPCFKREVCAVIINKKGQIATGQNLISNGLIGECPRDVGEGYEKCTSICRQEGHAEAMAIQDAMDRKIDIEGANLYLMGHYRVCDSCQAGCDKHNLKVIIVNKEGK